MELKRLIVEILQEKQHAKTCLLIRHVEIVVVLLRLSLHEADKSLSPSIQIHHSWWYLLVEIHDE